MLFFAYHTLNDIQTQLKVFGRVLEGIPDIIPDHRRIILKDGYHTIAPDTSSTGVYGFRYDITGDDYKKLIEWEEKYRSSQVKLKSGNVAIVFIMKEDERRKLQNITESLMKNKITKKRRDIYVRR